MPSRSSVRGIALTAIAFTGLLPRQSARGWTAGQPAPVLLEDKFSQWVIANDKLCDSSGKPTRTIPAQLGTVCGVQ